MKKTNSPFKYQNWVNNSLLEVIKKTIYTIEQVGLYENIHFFITFKTNHNEVKIPDSLKEKYPTTMTIVLQNQFYNLNTNSKGFGVTLYFFGKAEELFIPWKSIIQLLDPVTPISLKISEAPEDETPKNQVKVIKFPQKKD